MWKGGRKYNENNKYGTLQNYCNTNDKITKFEG